MLLAAVLAAVASHALVAQRCLAGGSRGAARAPPLRAGPRLGAKPKRKSAAAYPNLARLEDIIRESCELEEDLDKGGECIKIYERLITMHFKSQQECDLDSVNCVVLEVIERASAGISGVGGLVVLRHLREAVAAFEAKYKDRDMAFDSADTDSTGDLDKAKFRASLRTVGLNFPDMTVDRLFMAADANHDGVIERDEFADFMLAGVFAAEPLANLVPAKKGSTEDLLDWAVRGRMGHSSLR